MMKNGMAKFMRTHMKDGLIEKVLKEINEL